MCNKILRKKSSELGLLRTFILGLNNCFESDSVQVSDSRDRGGGGQTNVEKQIERFMALC